MGVLHLLLQANHQIEKKIPYTGDTESLDDANRSNNTIFLLFFAVEVLGMCRGSAVDVPLKCR